MTVYYNENDPRAAAWLRELMWEGHIPIGDVDERSIEDVPPRELAGYTQCHFFAGIGGWPYALRLAGWPDDREVWTGSCPCQPFSAAGKGEGFADERHLWPAWEWLIRACGPAVIFGEQVASPAGLNWFDLVQADLEGSGYAVGGADLCAAGVGAPHIRQRLYWVAHHHHLRRLEHEERDSASLREGGALGDDLGGRREHGMAHAAGERLEVISLEYARAERAAAQRGGEACGPIMGERTGAASGGLRGAVADADGGDTRAKRLQRGGQLGQQPRPHGWARCEWIVCTDGKSRPVEPGTFPLAHGVPERVGLLRGYGNAIVPQVAAAFIEATGLLG